MNHPPCFDSQEQFDNWQGAAENVYRYGGSHRTPYCTDCTPTYAAAMRSAGRCVHVEVKFYKQQGDYVGVAASHRPDKRNLDFVGCNLEEAYVPDATVASTHAR